MNWAKIFTREPALTSFAALICFASPLDRSSFIAVIDADPDLKSHGQMVTTLSKNYYDGDRSKT
jgi:hypothetical protein